MGKSTCFYQVWESASTGECDVTTKPVRLAAVTNRSGFGIASCRATITFGLSGAVNFVLGTTEDVRSCTHVPPRSRIPNAHNTAPATTATTMVFRMISSSAASSHTAESAAPVAMKSIPDNSIFNKYYGKFSVINWQVLRAIWQRQIQYRF